MSLPELHKNAKLQMREFASLFLADDSVIADRFQELSWWKLALVLGFILAFVQLLLVQNPSVCYLKAVEQVKGIEVTLPEAMASVNAWSWYNLLIAPPLFLLLFSSLGWITQRVSRWFGGEGGFAEHFGAVITVAYLLTVGQIMGYLLVASADLKRLIDFRDLSPGLGIGIFPYFSLERMGPFFWEVVRGLDLFGIAAIMLSSRLLRAINGYRQSTAICLSILYYALFISFRWLFEGPGHQFWVYFWTAGSV